MLVVTRANLCRICDKDWSVICGWLLIVVLGEAAFLAILAVNGQLNI
jgi:hypothetical protein